MCTPGRGRQRCSDRTVRGDRVAGSTTGPEAGTYCSVPKGNNARSSGASPPTDRAPLTATSSAPTLNARQDASAPTDGEDKGGPGPAARAVDAVKVFGRGDTTVRAIDDVTVAFARSELTAIMGPSGSGKSTLMHCMAGLDELTSGSTWIGDQRLTGMNDNELTLLRRDRIGFVFQAYNLVPTLDALENIELPLRLGGRHADPTWLASVVEVLGLGDRLHHRPSELSGGQQQRVAAARALISKPDLVFADEPTGNLDSRSATELLDLIRGTVNRFGQTVVMVTHDPRAAAYADRVIFLADGRLVHDMATPTIDRILDRLKTLGA